MSLQRDKSTQPKRKRSQPTLISNFFKRVESPNNNKAGKSKPQINQNGHDHPPRSSSPVGTSSSDVEDDGEDGHVTKRPRLETPPLASSGAGERNALTALMSPKTKEFRPAPESPRTARYKYIPSSPNKEDENVSPEEQAKKKSLHERFVQKLGRPDSMTTRRPSSPGAQTDDDGEDGDIEEAEEEVKATTRVLRSAPSTKLTPLERQYVEIKKKYPDTLLLIEVGYKFRFFGEDAKVLPCRN